MNTRKKIEEILLTDYGCFDDFTVDKLCDLFNVRLSFFQPEKCPEWIEGVGDCKKPDCTFCKIEAEIEGNEA